LNAAEPRRPSSILTFHCIWRIAVAATDIASQEPYKDMPLPDPDAFTLQGRENFIYVDIRHIRNNTEQKPEIQGQASKSSVRLSTKLKILKKKTENSIMKILLYLSSLLLDKPEQIM